jgi:hypothetical protein
MAYLWISCWCAVLFLFATVSGNALAASDLVAKVKAHLYAERTAEDVSVPDAPEVVHIMLGSKPI